MHFVALAVCAAAARGLESGHVVAAGHVVVPTAKCDGPECADITADDNARLILPIIFLIAAGVCAVTLRPFLSAKEAPPPDLETGFSLTEQRKRAA